jgi:hypothetical protein
MKCCEYVPRGCDGYQGQPTYLASKIGKLVAPLQQFQTYNNWQVALIIEIVPKALVYYSIFDFC